MAVYLIGYDLHVRRDYTRVLELMATWKAVKLLDSTWLAVLKGDAGSVRDIVMGTLDGDDSVAVIQLIPGAEWATYLNRASPAPAFLRQFVTP